MIKKREYFTKNSIEELWTFEKSTFRFWIIAFFVGLLVLSALVLAQIIVLAVNFENIRNEALEVVKDATTKPSNFYIGLKTFAYDGVILGFLVFILITYANSVKLSYKEHDFSKISYSSLAYALTILLFNVVLIISNLATSGGNGLFIFSNLTGWRLAYAILKFIFFVVMFLVCFLLRREVLAIKKAFLAIHQRKAFEDLRKEFTKMVKNEDAQNPFVNMGNWEKMTEDEIEEEFKYSAENTSKPNHKKESEDAKKKEEIQKLLDLPNEKLFKIAEMLNIFDYEKLSKDELAEKIYFYTTTENQKNKEDK
ncbi:hypothetical protein [Mycoplasmopsis glycophila]|uniref:Uncharacterized protein n=1 Tax=Mycoplasmopsis glycophila TaxID=171285 RepID=A0A449AWN7_9BACT|nr:hypothetical protein [Mycoplasmopsis glycophila]VEU71162.1 Uncharacterised protein [Mycoplasmopsis glycophila]